MEVIPFVLSQLPPVPARVLEIGCGAGELARAVDAEGYEVTAVDPAAPEGPIFRRLKFEELDEEERFDVVVAVRSLHHVTDLGPAFDKIARHLTPAGRLVVEEFAWDLLAGATAEWFFERLVAAGGDEARATLDACCRDWEATHVGLHGFDAMRAELDRRFDERFFSWEPYLFTQLPATGEELERELIESGSIQAVAFRFAGDLRPDAL